MITLELTGGLGNQLFEYAACYALAQQKRQGYLFIRKLLMIKHARMCLITLT